MLYLWVKLVHIISSTILFGTGIGTATVMLYGHFQKNINVKAAINSYVVLVDWVFTGLSGLIQPVTGLLMVYLAGYSLTTFWIIGSIIGYLIAAFCWFIVVYLQIKIKKLTVLAAKNNSQLTVVYYYYFRWWFILGWPAFLSLLSVFYLMTLKPTF